FMFALSLAWLLFDPYLQAVHTVRCFHAESRQTGEDIRAGLRRIRMPRAFAALLLLAAVGTLRAADVVSPGALEDSIQQRLSAPEYSWHNPAPATHSGSVPWIVSITQRVLTSMKKGWDAVVKLIGRVLNWIFGGLNLEPGKGSLSGGGLNWTLYLLIAVIAGLALWAVWRYRLLRRRKAKPAEAEPITVVRLEEENLTADLLPEQSWLELAEQCLREGNPRLALRALFLANLAWLGRLEFIAINPGKTNREYELELRRRTRTVPEVRDLFAANVASFERAWYGLHEVSPEQIEAFRANSASLKPLLEPSAQGVAA